VDRTRAQTPLIIKFERPFHSIQQKFSQLKWPKMLISNRKEVQLWDLEKQELVYSSRPLSHLSPRDKHGLTPLTYFHMKWIPSISTAIAFTSNSMTIFKLDEPDSPPISHELKALVTAVHADSLLLVTGDITGNITLRNPKTGEAIGTASLSGIYDSTDKPSNPLRSSQKDHSDLDDTDGIVMDLSKKINRIVVEHDGPLKVCDCGVS
jgi:hypothetical protein